MSELLRKLQTIHEALDSAGYDHAVGGALALAFHTRSPRTTNDIDLNIACDPDHPEELVAILPPQVLVPAQAMDRLVAEGDARFYWPDPGQDAEDGTPVDVFLPVDPEFHGLVNRRAERTDLVPGGIKILSATDLTIFKTNFGRSKDWVDIEEMLKFGKVDLAEADYWVQQILGRGDGKVRRLRSLIAEFGDYPDRIVTADRAEDSRFRTQGVRHAPSRRRPAR